MYILIVVTFELPIFNCKSVLSLINLNAKQEFLVIFIFLQISIFNLPKKENAFVRCTTFPIAFAA